MTTEATRRREYAQFETQLKAMPPRRMTGALRRYVTATTPAGLVYVVIMPTGARHHIAHTADGRRWLIVRRWWGRIALRMPVGQWSTSVSEVQRAGGIRFLATDFAASWRAVRDLIE
ncbi:hypothetical protein [Nocardia pseudovaccinii]|uniref:hypothetical protein n=1 Tax=Nocardia pseudovaccinii TaxID=189540 RepID=UPI0007A3E2FE|nr:hypothetical protein [Nocardia pseudovaccinii]